MHVLYEIGQWLVANNLFKDILGLVVAFTFGWVMRLGKRLRHIEDHLNAATPGGLGDINQSLHHIKAAITDQTTTLEEDK